MALTVPMVCLGRDGMLPARRMVEHRTFIMSQAATVYLADMDLRDHQLRCNVRVRLFGN